MGTLTTQQSPDHPLERQTAAEPVVYPCNAVNMLSTLGYAAAITILMLTSLLGFDGVTLFEVFTYAIVPITFHGLLELGGRLRLMSPSLHTSLYEIVGMLIWVASFAYAATLLNEMRPLLLIGSFLTVNFSFARGQVGLGARVTLAVSAIYLLPAFTKMLFDGDASELCRDALFVGGFLLVSLHGSICSRAFRPHRKTRDNSTSNVG